MTVMVETIGHFLDAILTNDGCGNWGTTRWKHVNGGYISIWIEGLL